MCTRIFFFATIIFSLRYWRIDELFLDPCCALKYYPEIESCFKEFESDKKNKQRADDRKKYEEFGKNPIGRFRKKLWNITEYPETSLSAQVIFSCIGKITFDAYVRALVLVKNCIEKD